MEASVALEQQKIALVWMERYVQAPYTDAFALGSTLRQRIEVWQLDPQVEPGRLLLPILRAELLKREGGLVEIPHHDLEADRKAGTVYEKVLGADSLQT